MSLTRRNCGTGHAYKLDGANVTGVTTLIKGGLPAPGLIGWTGRVVAEFVADADDTELAALRALGRDPMVAALRALPFEKRSEASVRGTTVHRFVERLSHGEAVDYGDGPDDITPEIAPHVESGLAFLDEWQPAPVLTEALVGCRWMPYAGTLDLVADVPDVGRVLIDYKTGDSGIWPETVLQLAAYRFADFFVTADGTELPMTELGINAAWAVWVRADGYDAIPIDTGTDRDTSVPFQTFRAAAYVARRVDAIKAAIGDALTPPRKVAA